MQLRSLEGSAVTALLSGKELSSGLSPQEHRVSFASLASKSGEGWRISITPLDEQNCCVLPQAEAAPH